MWNPEKTGEEVEKSIILGIAKKQIKKDLEKVNKKIDKLSKEYFKMDPFETSQKRLVNKRLNLDVECEERDRLERRLKIIENWRGEIQ